MLTNYSSIKLRSKHSPDLHFTSHRPDSHLNPQPHPKVPPSPHSKRHHGGSTPKQMNTKSNNKPRSD